MNIACVEYLHSYCPADGTNVSLEVSNSRLPGVIISCNGRGNPSIHCNATVVEREGERELTDAG